MSNSEEKGKLDESDRFMMDPLGFVTELAGNWSEPPSHIVMFASEERKLRDFIIQHSFREARTFDFNSNVICFFFGLKIGFFIDDETGEKILPRAFQG